MRAAALIFLLFCGVALAAELSAEGNTLLKQASESKFYSQAMSLKPKIISINGGKSFAAVYSPSDHPSRWIVSLHGHDGFATDDIAVWSRHLEGRDVGLVALQWWRGKGERMQDYLTPPEIYRAIDELLPELGASPGDVLLHGFSRGSAVIYAVAALDAAHKRYFSTIIASSGAVQLDYPPSGEIEKGRFGEKPFGGQNWITSCGERDQNPERDGCPAMRRTAEWIKGKGGNVALQIEDPDGGHGALVTNSANAKRVLDYFTIK